LRNDYPSQVTRSIVIFTSPGRPLLSHFRFFFKLRVRFHLYKVISFILVHLLIYTTFLSSSTIIFCQRHIHSQELTAKNSEFQKADKSKQKPQAFHSPPNPCSLEGNISILLSIDFALSLHVSKHGIFYHLQSFPL
jgi:hypothetical protein